MKKVIIVFFTILLISTFLSCEKDNDSEVLPQKRDYQTQYNEEIIKIENYLKTHSISVVSNPGFPDDQNVDYAVVPELDANSIWGTNPLVPNANVLTKLVTVEGVVHKIYYLKFRDGIGTSPNTNSQIKAYYKAVLLDAESTQFDISADGGENLPLNQLILGWQYILPEFKMGTILGVDQYEDFGAGVMFLPSALGYYDVSMGAVPPYSPLIFNFKLFNVF